MRPNGDSAARTRARHPHLASMAPGICPLTRRGRDLLATATQPRPHTALAPARALDEGVCSSRRPPLSTISDGAPPPLSHLHPAPVVRTPRPPTLPSASIARPASAPPSNNRNGLLLNASTPA